MKLLIINPGATSTKIAVYDGDTEVFRRTIEHSTADLASFEHVVDQFDYRRQLVVQALAEAGWQLSDFAAVCGRGGLLRHIPSGTYRINDRVIADIQDPPYGEHASFRPFLSTRCRLTS